MEEMLLGSARELSNAEVGIVPDSRRELWSRLQDENTVGGVCKEPSSYCNDKCKSFIWNIYILLKFIYTMVPGTKPSLEEKI